MNFSFRFSSVLKVRKHQKKKEKQKLGVLLKRRSGLEQQMYDLQHKCRSDAFESHKQSVAANRRYYAQKHDCHKQLIKIKNMLRALHDDIHQQRSLLREAVKRMRMLEKIKEHDKRAFIDRIEHVEQLQQNEIAIQRFNSTN